MANDKRRHKRYRSTHMDLSGRMILSQKVEIIDISLSGAALKTDRKLMVGREYPLRLVSKGKSLDVWGIVVRSEMTGIEKGDGGKKVSIYSVGVMFKDVSQETIAGFIDSIERVRKEAVAPMVDKRLNVRFALTTPDQLTLSFPEQFKVHEISLSGARILMYQALSIESIIPMWLSLDADKHIIFVGRVASCRKMEEKGQAHFEIGIEFKDLTDTDKALLKTFIDYLSMMEMKTDSK